MLRATVDTNVWVSAAINPRGYPARIARAFVRQEFSLVICEPLLQELTNVLGRSHVARRIGVTAEEQVDLLALLRDASEMVELLGIEPICRNASDDRVIETAIRGNADYIVTRDDDLKFADEVHTFLANHSIQVLSASRFLDVLAAERPDQ